jgi:hypothetical protein
VIWKVSIAKVRKKKNLLKNGQIIVFGFQCVAIYIYRERERERKGWLKYMVCSQIWLNLPRDNRHFFNMHKILWQPVKWNLALLFCKEIKIVKEKTPPVKEKKFHFKVARVLVTCSTLVQGWIRIGKGLLPRASSNLRVVASRAIVQGYRGGPWEQAFFPRVRHERFFIQMTEGGFFNWGTNLLCGEFLSNTMKKKTLECFMPSSPSYWINSVMPSN